MTRTQRQALAMLEAIERHRSGTLPLEELEQQLWRLLDADAAFPARLHGQVEDLVQGLRRLHASNAGFDDPDRGSDRIYNEVTSELGRLLDE